MFKTVVLILSALLFASCSLTPRADLKANQKVFEEEDMYILYALHAKESKDFKSAASLFDTLYLKSEKKEYLYQALENYLLAKENEQLLQKVQTLSPSLQEDAKVVRFKIVALFELNRLEEAEKIAMDLAKKTQSSDNHLLVGDVLIKSKQYDFALRYLESAYAKEYNEKILDKIAIILYVNLSRQKDAIAQLESHSRIHGISRLIAARLLGFYSDQNNIEGVLSTYKRLYALDKEEEIAKKIVQIYVYKRDYLRLVAFLEESKIDDTRLLQLYSSAKNYAKAYHLSQKLYETTGEINYLGQSGIYQYESAESKKDKKMLQDVVEKLTRVIAEDRNPTFLNYLGYLLIDHNIDIKLGMSYIKEVLVLEPESAYYLDSLAWGYYKLGECKKAQTIIKKVQKLEGGDHAEVLEHVLKIEQCMKNQYKGKK